jgi:hypothetical protein
VTIVVLLLVVGDESDDPVHHLPQQTCFGFNLVGKNHHFHHSADRHQTQASCPKDQKSSGEERLRSVVAHNLNRYPSYREGVVARHVPRRGDDQVRGCLPLRSCLRGRDRPRDRIEGLHETSMVTRAERSQDFIIDADPPFGGVVEVLCEDHVGTYLLRFLCRSTPEGLRNERTGELIEGRVIDWWEPKHRT